MKPKFIRTYRSMGTNGKPPYQDTSMMFIIEIPKKGNSAQVMCKPQGRRELIKRYNDRFNWPWQPMDFLQLKGILVCPAMDVLQELQICVVLVSFLNRCWKGALPSLGLTGMQTLTRLVYGPPDQHESEFITLKSQRYEST